MRHIGNQLRAHTLTLYLLFHRTGKTALNRRKLLLKSGKHPPVSSDLCLQVSISHRMGRLKHFAIPVLYDADIFSQKAIKKYGIGNQ